MKKQLLLVLLALMPMMVSAEEVEIDGHPFRRRSVFRFMIRYICPVFVIIILLSSVANAFGLIKM